MENKIKKISSLILGAITSLNSTSEEIITPNTEIDPFSSIKVGALNFNIPQYLAAHSSHSSHASHRSSSGSSHSNHSSHASHRSSSTSSGSATPARTSPATIYSAPTTTIDSKSIKKSDPLGRPSTPSGTYNKNQDSSLSTIRNDKDELKALLKRVQFQLQHYGYYKGVIDGIMGPTTRQALNAYRASRGLTISPKLDVETLNSLGILVY